MGIPTAARVELADQKPVEEHYYRRGDIDFCFLLNRRHANLRVFDYRVGNYQQKRDFFDRIARAEGLRKVFTVVEKQDSKSWRSVGFSREGAIPGYFRTADAYIMSRVYTEDGDPIQGGAPKLVTTPAPTPASVKEKDVNPQKPRGFSHEITTDLGRIDRATEELAASAIYAPFRRAPLCADLAVVGKIGRKEYWVTAETDSSFGHAKIDLLTAPEKDTDLPVLAYTMKLLFDELTKLETASLFSIVAADVALTNQTFAEMGFKVTARLTDHVTKGDELVGAHIWHRRLGTAAPPRMPTFI
jgi:hypothetical protein